MAETRFDQRMKGSILLVVCLIGGSFGCRHDGKTYLNGDTWTEKGAFKMQCIVEDNGSWHTKILGCLVNGVLVDVGQKKTVGDSIYHCQKQENGQVQLSREMSGTAACVDNNGKRHSVGDKWLQSKNFQMSCGAGGRTNFVGCLANGQLIGVNSSKTVNGVQHHCESGNDGTFRYYTGPKQ